MLDIQSGPASWHHHDRCFVELADAEDLRTVAVGNVLMHSSRRRLLADTLCAIRLGRTVDELGGDALLNAERRLRSELEMRRIFAGYEDALRNTMRIAEVCTLRLDEISYEYPDEILNGIDPDTRLRQLTEEGLRWRYPGGTPPSVRELVEKNSPLSPSSPTRHTS